MMLDTEHFVTIAPAAPALGETQPLTPLAEPTPTAPIALPARDRALLYLAAGSSVLALVLAVALVLALGSRPTLAATATKVAVATPTPPLMAIVPTELIRAELPPGEYWPLGALPVALTAYDAPDGAVLGALEPGRQYAVMGEAYDGAWLQLVLAGVGGGDHVWVKAAGFGDAPITRRAQIADLTPPTPQPAPSAVPQPQIVYAAAPAEAAQPEQPTAVELQPQPTAEMRVLVDTPERYVAVAVPPPGATAQPDEWGSLGGGGGSWGP
jgi:hypothetical protein